MTTRPTTEDQVRQWKARQTHDADRLERAQHWVAWYVSVALGLLIVGVLAAGYAAIIVRGFSP